MPVRIKVNEMQIAHKIDTAWETGREMLCSQILKDCNLYCKEDTGMLIMSSYIHSDLKKGRLVWATPYAAKQYYAIPTAFHDVNPNAVWRWVEYAQTMHGADWGKMAQAITRYYK